MNAGRQSIHLDGSVWVLTEPKGERQINGVKHGTLVRFNNGGKRIKIQRIKVQLALRRGAGEGGGRIEGNPTTDACVKEGKAASEKDKAKSLRQNRV